MELKYKETTRDDMRLAENIESVKEVSLTCERKIKEFKVHKIPIPVCKRVAITCGSPSQ